MKSNSLIRLDMEDMHTNCVELVKVSVQAIERRKLAQQANYELMEQNKKLKDQLSSSETESAQLRKRSQALDGLTVLAEAAQKL